MIFTALGAGLDLSRAYLARQKISQVAAMACQFSNHANSSDTAAPTDADATAQVTNFINTTSQTQNVTLSQPPNTPSFTYVQGGNSTVNLVASVPTTFMELWNIYSIPISVQVNCKNTLPPPPTGTNPQTLINESFEAVHGAANNGWTTYLPNGQQGTQSTPTGWTSAIGYTGAGGTKWHITGYCIEQDIAGQIKSNAYDGRYTVELDCDNGINSAGNSSISTSINLAAGSYELRYAYASRVDYPSYDPAYLCGSAASDLNWANSNSTSWTGSMATVSRTNQINVYLDPDVNGAPPMHNTLYGTPQGTPQSLAGSNLIDMCLYGQSWIQRSVTINVTTPGTYWLSFAGDGTSDSYGGQLDDILLCSPYCSGSVQDNYATAWPVNSLLFEDNFESPTYSNSGSGYNSNGNVNNSDGNSNYWNVSGNGWSNAPINQIPYWLSGCPQGKQCVELGWYGGTNTNNSLISQSFLFVPGYYKIQYNYVSEVTFKPLGSTVYCGATPAAANMPTLTAGSGDAINRVLGVDHGTLNYDTNAVGVFMSHAQLASTPNSGNNLGTATSYSNPDPNYPNGSTAAAATIPPNYISLSSYDAAQVNPLIDFCGYAKTPQTRTAYVFIPKPAYYWLTLSALGTADGFGGQIDDVTITAVGSPYMSSPPSSAVTIPVPSPQPSTGLYFNGFSIAADPLAP